MTHENILQFHLKICFLFEAIAPPPPPPPNENFKNSSFSPFSLPPPFDFEKFQFPPDFAELKNSVPHLTHTICNYQTGTQITI